VFVTYLFYYLNLLTLIYLLYVLFVLKVEGNFEKRKVGSKESKQTILVSLSRLHDEV